MVAFGAKSVFAQGDVEIYRVYDAVIAEMFKGGNVTFDTQAVVKMYVINDTTTTSFASDENKENWDQVKIRLPKLSDDLIKVFESRLKSPTRLERRFNLGLSYVLVDHREFERVWDKSPDWWSEFYKKYPDSGGVVTFSNVAFSKDGDQALVYFFHWCRQLCGTGHYLLLNKNEKTWTVVNKGEMWIS